jgi:hypothetical protein
VFYNGAKLAAAEFTATNGTSIVLGTACVVNDIVEVVAYNYTVGAFTGVGGSGTANTIAKWTASGTINNSIITESTNTISINTSGPGLLTLGASNSYGAISSGGGGVNFYMNGATRGGSTTAASNTAVLALDGEFYITNSAVNSNKLILTSSGNVAIGVTSPSTSTFAHLFVGRNFSIFSGSSNDIYFGSNFYYNGGFKARYAEPSIMISSANGDIIFQNSSSGTADASLTVTEKLRITSSGFLGIGTSSPVAPLTIAVPTTGASIGASNTQTAYDYSRFRIKHYTESNLGLSIGYAGANYTYIQACYNEGTAAPLLINPYGSNTGVGTATPRARLDVGGAIMTLYQASTIADKAAGIFCESTGSGLTTGFGFLIQDGFCFQGDNAGNNRKISVRKPTANGSLGDLVAHIDSAAGNSFFAGRMERTGQPSFQAHRTSGGNQSISSGIGDLGAVIVFDGVYHNTGSHYNSSNGRFTAPVTGRYNFSSTTRFDGSTSGTYIRLFFTINGSSGSSANYTFGHVIAGPNGYSSNYHSLTVTATLSLNSGDYVETRGYIATGSTGIQYESQFSGFLI